MTAYYDEDPESFAEHDSIPVGVIMNWAGALVSFLLMVGLGIWGYQLLMRDVTGVPVVRALEGPMRITPENPGGVEAEYQGLSVTRVASDGALETPIERVILAPPPVRLEDEDQPVTALIPDTPSVDPAAAAEEAEKPLSAVELALAEALGQPTNVVATAATGEAEITRVGFQSGDATGIQIIPASVAGVSESPRPVARPRNIIRTAAVSTDTQPTPAVTSSGLDVPADAIPAGTRLVQLGAFPTLEGAQEAWASLEQDFGDYLAGKKRVVQETTAGGSTFYRLRAMGFSDLSDARRFCAVLVAEDANCIPVIRR